MSAHASPSGGKSPRARRCPECKAELYCIACTGADDPVEEKEFDTVVACMRWFDETYPQYCLVRWHSAMGARMYAKEMQKLKKMGALVGAPDFSLMVPSVDGQWHTLNVEFKQQGNNPNKYPQQVAVGKALKQVGQQYKVVFNLAQFKAAVVTHLEPPPQTTPAPAVSVDLTQEQDKEELTLSESESDDLILIDSPGPETFTPRRTTTESSRRITATTTTTNTSPSPPPTRRRTPVFTVDGRNFSEVMNPAPGVEKLSGVIPSSQLKALRDTTVFRDSPPNRDG